MYFMPRDPENHFYIRYCVDNGYACEIHENCYRTLAEYMNALANMHSHNRYFVMKNRPPMPTGLTRFQHASQD